MQKTESKTAYRPYFLYQRRWITYFKSKLCRGMGGPHEGSVQDCRRAGEKARKYHDRKPTSAALIAGDRVLVRT